VSGDADVEAAGKAIGIEVTDDVDMTTVDVESTDGRLHCEAPFPLIDGERMFSS
jgi:hypothetical protein